MRTYITNTIRQFIEDYARQQSILEMWENPIVRFASAHDPLFRELKHIVGESHETPKELLVNAETVICYFIPFARSVPKSNKDNKVMASEEWASAYVETNKLIIALNDRIASRLKEEGFDSAVLPPTHNFDKKSLVSDWSHKHVGYIAGIGKFGLHHMLITDKGCCGRLGSVVTSAYLSPSTRTEIEYCLNRSEGTCGVCIGKCPLDALNPESVMDKQRCYDYLLEHAEKYKALGMADVCGKCSSMTPCSFLNPVRKRVQKSGTNTMGMEEAEAPQQKGSRRNI